MNPGFLTDCQTDKSAQLDKTLSQRVNILHRSGHSIQSYNYLPGYNTYWTDHLDVDKLQLTSSFVLI